MFMGATLFFCRRLVASRAVLMVILVIGSLQLSRDKRVFPLMAFEFWFLCSTILGVYF